MLDQRPREERKGWNQICGLAFGKVTISTLYLPQSGSMLANMDESILGPSTIDHLWAVERDERANALVDAGCGFPLARLL